MRVFLTKTTNIDQIWNLIWRVGIRENIQEKSYLGKYKLDPVYRPDCIYTVICGVFFSMSFLEVIYSVNG